MNKQVNEAILKIATKNKLVADLLIDYNSENKSVIEEAKQELKKNTGPSWLVNHQGKRKGALAPFFLDLKFFIYVK